MGKQPKGLGWVADFETTTTADDCRVWLWAVCGISDVEDWDWGTSISSFMDYAFNLGSGHVYFHNLAFDGSFIIDWLFNEGYTFNQGRAGKNQFTTLISKMGKFYSVVVVNARGVRIEFRDSMKKLPMSVKNVAHAFKQDEGKGDIDFTLNRRVGYVPTVEELDYVRRDVQIVARALKTQLAAGMTRLTVGADSLAEYKRIMGGKRFERMFPILAPTIDADIRRAYRGGYTYVAERFRAKRLGVGRVYDVNSLYPSVMYNEMLPYGEPVWFRGAPVDDADFPLYVVTLTFTAKLKRNHLPTIQIKGSPHFASTVYQNDIVEPVTMTATNVDLALWRDQYDINVLSWEGGWKFHGVTGFFNEYIDKWMGVKENSVGGIRFIAKLHLNSLYGKFATNPDVTPKIPVMVDGIVKLIVGDEETRNPVYTPVGVFITAYARNVTIRAAQRQYDVFAYADTDSLHLLTNTNPADLDIHPSRLGAWKYEGMFDGAIFVRAKCYSEHMVEDERGNPVDHHSTHVAGLPESVAERVTLDDIKDGTVWRGKLAPRRVPGGIVLEDVGFTLNI